MDINWHDRLEVPDTEPKGPCVPGGEGRIVFGVVP